jgi:hypothetical protein
MTIDRRTSHKSYRHELCRNDKQDLYESRQTSRWFT